mmetsp:Transcript_5985/g.20383  ORF Transcript_5985/g.20383 Transcript_5985/m.20383 type:complete len:204 (+) Transcript_5985:1088-1699(+)
MPTRIVPPTAGTPDAQGLWRKWGGDDSGVALCLVQYELKEAMGRLAEDRFKAAAPHSEERKRMRDNNEIMPSVADAIETAEEKAEAKRKAKQANRVRCKCRKALPTLGLLGGEAKEAQWCAKCPDKPANAVNVTQRRCKCRKAQPTLGLLGWEAKEAQWCAKCPDKPANAVNVTQRRCALPRDPSFSPPPRRGRRLLSALPWL